MHTKDYKYEVPDKTPVEMPLGYEKPEPLEHMIARMVRTFSMAAEAQGAESFEESDDFDVDDDSELHSPYQLSDMQEETPNGYHLNPKSQKRRASDRTPPQSKEEGPQSHNQEAAKATPKEGLKNAENVAQ